MEDEELKEMVKEREKQEIIRDNEKQKMMKKIIQKAKDYVNYPYEADRLWIVTTINEKWSQELYGGRVDFLILNGTPHRGYIIIDYDAYGGQVRAFNHNHDKWKTWKLEKEMGW